MSVRFSLRFEGRSVCRLLGVAMCEEPGCENVVAILVFGSFALNGVLISMFLDC